MFCPRCGHEQVSNETRFCSRCGITLGLVANLLDNSQMRDSAVESSGDCFTITEFRKDDPRLSQFEIPEKEDQSSFLAEIQLIPGDELEIEDFNIWNHCQLTLDDFNRLRSIGLKGKLRNKGYGTLGEPPYKARTLIVLEHQIREAVDLPQPDACDLIYYQVGDELRRFPAEAPVLQKRFRLSIDQVNENITYIWHEAYFGSWAGGGGGFSWDDIEGTYAT